MDALPLAGTVVLDFSQFLAGPVAALRLADLGARVIKIERPVTGEIGRGLAFAGRRLDGDTLSFHAMNRNKEAVVADLKDPADLARVRELVRSADVLIQNFRPGVMERLGLGHEAVRRGNPGLVYASATGYGTTGPWARRPGQDLLAQSISALPWVGGEAGRPVPVGLAVADHLLSCHLAEGVTALLVRRERTGLGGLVETSLLEAVLDLQSDRLTAHLNGGTADRTPPAYGLYRTADGHVAIAAASAEALCRALGAEPGAEGSGEPGALPGWAAGTLRGRPTAHWLDVLGSAGIPCGPVLTLEELLAHPEFAAAEMTQVVERPAAEPDGRPVRLTTTRSPVRIDGERPRSGRAAPRLGAQGRVGRGVDLPGISRDAR